MRLQELELAVLEAKEKVQVSKLELTRAKIALYKAKITEQTEEVAPVKTTSKKPVKKAEPAKVSQPKKEPVKYRLYSVPRLSGERDPHLINLNDFEAFINYFPTYQEDLDGFMDIWYDLVYGDNPPLLGKMVTAITDQMEKYDLPTPSEYLEKRLWKVNIDNWMGRSKFRKLGIERRVA